MHTRQLPCGAAKVRPAGLEQHDHYDKGDDGDDAATEIQAITQLALTSGLLAALT